MIGALRGIQRAMEKGRTRMKRIVAIVITALSVTLTGCLNSRNGQGS